MGLWRLFRSKESEQGLQHCFQNAGNIFMAFIIRWCCSFINVLLSCVFIYCLVSIVSHVLVYFKTSTLNVRRRACSEEFGLSLKALFLVTLEVVGDWLDNIVVPTFFDTSRTSKPYFSRNQCFWGRSWIDKMKWCMYLLSKSNGVCLIWVWIAHVFSKSEKVSYTKDSSQTRLQEQPEICSTRSFHFGKWYYFNLMV